MRPRRESEARAVDTKHIAKLLSLHEKGVITTSEITQSLLIDLVGSDVPDVELPSLVAGLPEKVRKNLLDLLRVIRTADYCWSPFMLGPGGSVLQTKAEDSAKLRRICTALEREPVPGRA
jgi:hypothetical protein